MKEQTRVARLLTTEEVADLLAISAHTLTNWRSRRVGPAFMKAGGLVRYRQCDLDEWIESRLRPTEDSDNGARRDVIVPLQAGRRRTNSRLGGYRTKRDILAHKDGK